MRLKELTNDIEIMTCANENCEASRIVFRNVDGKYLLKKKVSNPPSSGKDIAKAKGVYREVEYPRGRTSEEDSQ